MTEQQTKSLGGAIDEIVTALSALPENLRLTAVRAACESIGLSFSPGLATGTHQSFGQGGVGAGVPATTAPAEVSSLPQDIRSLKDAKQPKNNQEMACVMAYYLQQMAPAGERKTSVAATDVEKYFAQAGFPLPKAPGQALVDTKNAGYFDAVDRGTYKLNPVGHNLVVHGLPRKDGGGSRTSKPRPPAKKSR
jgi:hypothetical protein